MKLHLAEEWPEYFKVISFSLPISRFLGRQQTPPRGRKDQLHPPWPIDCKCKTQQARMSFALICVPGTGGRARSFPQHYSNTKYLAIFPVRKWRLFLKVHFYVGSLAFIKGKLQWTPEIFLFWKGSPRRPVLEGVTKAHGEPGEDHGNRTSSLTIPFIHHCSDDHREHATVQVKVQLRERNELRLHNSHQTCLRTTLEIVLVQWRALLTDPQLLLSKGHNRAGRFKIPGTSLKRESTTTSTHWD